jgi:uncharacterized protein YeaO (DUF488 family)
MGNEASTPASPAIQLKRAYEPSEVDDGVRVLVDRLWARGVSKDAADLDAWMKELGPTADLRKWFGHQAGRWDAFVGKYRLELKTPLRQLLLAELQGIAAGSRLTLIYGAHDTKENEAVVLRHSLLHDTIHADGTWDATTKLLVTASAVAAAHRDANAPELVLKLFASPVLAAPEFDSALQELLTRGKLRKSSDGWQLTTSGDREARQLAGGDVAEGASS